MFFCCSSCRELLHQFGDFVPFPFPTRSLDFVFQARSRLPRHLSSYWFAGFLRKQEYTTAIAGISRMKLNVYVVRHNPPSLFGVERPETGPNYVRPSLQRTTARSRLEISRIFVVKWNGINQSKCSVIHCAKYKQVVRSPPNTLV